jgi:hypothetical protein
VPMMSASNIHFEMAERARAVNCGGIGAMHLMVQKLGWAEAIDERVQLLKRHLPYHESDHVLNLAYNALLEGVWRKILSCGATTKPSWMDWERNGFRIQRPAATLRADSGRVRPWTYRKLLTPLAKKCGKSSRDGSLAKL